MKRVVVAALAAVLVFGMTGLNGMTSLAATRDKITSVSLKVEGTLEVGQEPDEQSVLVETRNETSNYSVQDWEFLDGGFVWEEQDIPQMKITLVAEDGYYFSLYTSDIVVKGVNSVITSEKEEDKTVLVVTVRFNPLAEQVSSIGSETLKWADDTRAEWGESIGAGNYEVKILRDGSTVGTTKTTTVQSYDFSNAMTKPGQYSFKVRPVNRVKPENKGAWVESPVTSVDVAMAERIRAKGSSGQWILDETGYWYRNGDGSYTVNNWQQINGQWYYFNENGYMKTGWIEVSGKSYYCDTATGAMLANTTTPDGKFVGIDGSLAE